ncbi:MAG: lysylphosphatidylglycerol synthase transmembrane domain-containing protein [Acidobacteriota bacterium]
MKYFKLLIVLILVCILLYFFFQNVEFGKVLEIIKDVNPVYIIIFIAGLYTQFFIRAYRWGILFRPFKKKISLLNLYHYSFIGMFINTLIPGRLGEPARGILIAREEGLESGSGLATIVIERMIDSMMIVVLFFTSLLFIDSSNSALLGKLKAGGVIFLPVVLVIFSMFYLINIPAVFKIVEKILRFVLRIVPKGSRENITEFFLNFIKGLKLKLGFTDSLKLLLSSIFVWVYLVPFYWYLMQGFKFGSSISVFDAIPYFSLIVMSAAIPTPGMAGSLDAASKHGLLELYKNTAGQSIVSVNEAAAYTLLVHVLIIVVILVPGFISFSSKGLKMSSVKKVGEKSNEMS